MATVTWPHAVCGAGFPTGLAHVGYTLDSGSRVDAVPEVPVSSGIYQASITYDPTVPHVILWDNGGTPAIIVPENTYPMAAVPPTASTIATAAAAAILTTPANLLGTDSSGRVILQPAGLDAIQVETGVNARQALSPILAAAAGTLT